MSFEWIDPFAEIAQANRRALAAEQREQEAHRSATRVLEDAMRRGLPDRLNMAMDGIANRVADHMAREVVAQIGYDYFAGRVAPLISEAFRKAAQQVTGALIDPRSAKSPLRVEMNRVAYSMDEVEVGIEFRTVRPITIAFRSVV